MTTIDLSTITYVVDSAAEYSTPTWRMLPAVNPAYVLVASRAAAKSAAPDLRRRIDPQFEPFSVPLSATIAPADPGTESTRSNPAHAHVVRPTACPKATA